MHFEFTITLGQLVTSLSIIFIGLRFHVTWILLVERTGIMWRWYERVHGLEPETNPKRRGRRNEPLP